MLRHGLVKPSFIPPAPIRDLRERTRYRKTLVQGRTQEVNRLHKLLAGTNRKRGAVATDILGKSGRAMPDALLGGEQEPTALAELARGRPRAKLPLLRQALAGRLRPVHLVLLAAILGHIDDLDGMVERLHDEIAADLAPFAEAVDLLQTIPGISAVAAAAIVAEIGVDMARFPSHQHLAPWAGVGPGNKQRGGTRPSGKTTKGSVRLRAVPTEAAWANARRHDGLPRGAVPALGAATRAAEGPGGRGPQPDRDHRPHPARPASLCRSRARLLRHPGGRARRAAPRPAAQRLVYSVTLTPLPSPDLCARLSSRGGAQAPIPGPTSGRGGAGGTRGGHGMEQRAILVVEDTAPIAEIIETVLNDIPAYRATAVNNGSDALAFVAEVAVALVLLDINMPGLDGFAIHDLLRARPATATVPIVFMTAGGHEAEFARRKVRGHIKKPFDLDDLLLRVASALHGDGGAVGTGLVGSPGG